MTRIFRIVPTAQFEQSEVAGEHRWSLPNVKCPVCPLIAGPFFSYPVVDLSTLPEADLFVRPRPVTLDRFRELATLVRPFIPSGLSIVPRLRLGRFCGTAKVAMKEYAVTSLGGTPLLRNNAWNRIRSSFPRLSAIAAEIHSKHEHRVEMVELQTQGTVSLARQAMPSGVLQVCEQCGRSNIRQLCPEGVVVRRSSITIGNDYFDILEFPVTPLVSERLKAAMEEAQISNVRFIEVEVSNE